jgi:serine/threonine protein kinase
MPGQDGSSDEESADELAFEMNIIASIAREYRRLGAESPSSIETAEWPTMKKWGQFELLDVVGEGSYGKVFRTMDPQLQREVALKLYHGRHDADRVIEEGRRLAKVRHPNVVTVHGADVVDGVAGIWMELIKGRGLDEVVSATGPMSAKEATNIGLELAGALAAVQPRRSHPSRRQGAERHARRRRTDRPDGPRRQSFGNAAHR